MVDVRTFQIHEAIQASAEKLRRIKEHDEYILEKIFLGSKPSHWEAWFDFIKPVEWQNVDLHTSYTIIETGFGELEDFEINVNDINFIHLYHLDVAIDIGVKFMGEYKGILSADLMSLNNVSDLGIDMWDIIFKCMNVENRRIYVDIRVDTEKQEVILVDGFIR